MKVVVTGGAGFIGSYLTEALLQRGYQVLVIDALTYAADPETNLKWCLNDKNFRFYKSRIEDSETLHLLKEFSPDVIFNLAAETHVDNSIENSDPFITSNINGVANLLKYVKEFGCKFFQISTDEVYGHLKPHQQRFSETHSLQPRSPYAASKASGDLLVKSYINTYGINAIITRCSNNFGARQHNEKLIPKIVESCITGNTIKLYGNGQNIRDWIWVKDHVKALLFLLDHGKWGETYNIGVSNEWKNIDLANEIKAALNSDSAIEFIQDRPGHDLRYAIDNTKIRLLGWEPVCTRKEFLSFLNLEIKSLSHQL